MQPRKAVKPLFDNLRKSEAGRSQKTIGLPLIFIVLLVPWLHGRASEPEDSLFTALDSIEVVGVRERPIRQGGSMEISQRRIMEGVRLLGEADAIKLISRQSGVTTAGDYGSGLMIDGNLPSHTLYRIDGVPVYFPYRFGGIFSTFNTAHFPSVDFERGIHQGSMPSRLGAKIDFTTGRSGLQSFSGMANVGMMASSLSLSFPVAEKFSFTLSGRISYVNLLYGWLLMKTSSGVKYDFGDVNFTGRYRPDEDNLITVNLFGNADRLHYDDRNYAMDTRIDWSNGLVSAEWRHTGSLRMAHRIYATLFDNSLKFLMPQLSIGAPSSIATYGLSGEFGKFFLSGSFNLEGGYEIAGHDARIQEVAMTGYVTHSGDSPQPRRPVEARIYADSHLVLPNGIRLDAGLSLSAFGRSGFFRWNPDPRVTLGLPVPYGTLSIHAGRYSQYLHQVGFSQIGLASDFWIDSEEGIAPEVSYNLELDFTGFLSAADLYFSVNIYGKRLLNQAELMGDLLSILDAGYEATDYILSADGYAAGANLNIRRVSGPLTGQLGLGYGLTRQKFHGGEKYFRARTEPGFTLNAELSYRFNAHWEAGAVFRYSTGRPYTPVTALYLIGGNVMKTYGDPNSALLPAWHRLDLSATWSAVSGPRTHPLTHLVNFSFINAYGRKNPEFFTYIIDIAKGVVKIKTVASLYRFFPSVSYTIKF